MASSPPPVVLVTGSSRGLGRGVAETLASAGFSVAIHYASNKEAAEATAAACKKLAPNPEQKFAVVGGNIGAAADRRRLFDETLAAYGHLDALVNNAGVAPRIRADITEATEEIFDEVIGINLKGPYFLSQLAARYWLANPGKSRLAGGYKLLFVTSVSANTASVNRGEYCISKAGLGMAVQLWAVRLADAGVQVLELRPGIMATDMTAGVKEKYDKLLAEGIVPQKRWGSPQDVGLAAKAILEGHFPFSTGDVINIDGGFHLRRL
ncbi:MAG: 3-ketoacyl-ACP reductase [Methylacidiphilales bacterium]|nr:3-ketoacyl-ACP reductase [Candidatus Methylacidiphilales bacterium]